MRINLEKSYEYACKYKLEWLKKVIDDNKIRFIPSEAQWEWLFKYPYSVVIFDEVGGKLDARNWAKKDREIVLRNIEQCRHNFTIFLGTAQYAEQTDAAIKETIRTGSDSAEGKVYLTTY